MRHHKSTTLAALYQIDSAHLPAVSYTHLRALEVLFFGQIDMFYTSLIKAFTACHTHPGRQDVTTVSGIRTIILGEYLTDN